MGERRKSTFENMWRTPAAGHAAQQQVEARLVVGDRGQDGGEAQPGHDAGLHQPAHDLDAHLGRRRPGIEAARQVGVRA